MGEEVGWFGHVVRRIRWFEHVVRRDEAAILGKSRLFEVQGRRPPGDQGRLGRKIALEQKMFELLYAPIQSSNICRSCCLHFGYLSRDDNALRKHCMQSLRNASESRDRKPECKIIDTKV